MNVNNLIRIDDIDKHTLAGKLECTLADLVTAGRKHERELTLNGQVNNQMWDAYFLYKDLDYFICMQCTRVPE